MKSEILSAVNTPLLCSRHTGCSCAISQYDSDGSSMPSQSCGRATVCRTRFRTRSCSQYVTQSAGTSLPSSTSTSGVKGSSHASSPAAATKPSRRSTSRAASAATPSKIRRMTYGHHSRLHGTLHVTRSIGQGHWIKEAIVKRIAVLSVVALAVMALVAPAAAQANEVTKWNEIAADTARALPPAAGGVPPVISINMAMTQSAVYDAVNAIERRHRPYLMWTLFDSM